MFFALQKYCLRTEIVLAGSFSIYQLKKAIAVRNRLSALPAFAGQLFKQGRCAEAYHRTNSCQDNCLQHVV
jgi:hypothetical protein